MKRIISLLSVVSVVILLTSCHVVYKLGEQEFIPPKPENDKIYTSTDDFKKSDIQHENGSLPSEVQNSDNRQTAITEPREKALLVALEKAGVAKQNAYDIEIEKDFENGIEYYEVEFKSGSFEYDVKIYAENMTVAIFKKETDN